MGGGVGLSVHSRYRIATEKTLFAMPETAIGLFPDVGGGYFLPRLQGSLGEYLALSGYRLKGRDNYFAGIGTHFVSTRELPYLQDELANMESPSTDNVANLLDSYHAKCDDSEAKFSLVDKLDKINSIFCHNTVEDIFAHLEKDGSDWAIKTLEVLRIMSPSSMKVTLKQLQAGRNMNFKELLEMEYRISQRCMEYSDFYEGIRALLVDRDNSPKWSPATVEDVSKELVDSYFAPLPAEKELVLPE